MWVRSSCARWLGAVLGVLGCAESPQSAPDPTPHAAVDPCGPGVPVCSVDRCDEAGCAAVEIARVSDPISVLAVDDTHVYFGAATSLYRVPKCGGGVELVFESAFGIRGLTLHDDSIYWFDFGMNEPAALGLGFHRTPKAGGPTVAIDPLDLSEGPSVSAVGLAVDNDAVYVARSATPGIQRVDAHGSTLLKGSAVAGPLLVDDVALYFATGSPSFITTMPKTGGPSTQIYVANETPFVQNSSSLFFVGPPGGGNYALVKGSKRGGVPTMMDPSAHAGTALAVDETCLYAGWVPSGVQELWIQRSPVSEPSWTRLVVTDPVATVIALDDASAYFGVTSNDGAVGSVLRLPK